MNMTVLWLIVAIVLFVIESITVGMVCIWFGIAAIISMLSTFITSNIYIQWFIFIVVALAMLILLRPFAKKAIQQTKQNTNASSLIGKKAYLIEGITPTQNGKVKFNDIVWSVISEKEGTISKGTQVQVISIKGNKLVVTTI